MVRPSSSSFHAKSSDIEGCCAAPAPAHVAAIMARNAFKAHVVDFIPLLPLLRFALEPAWPIPPPIYTVLTKTIRCLCATESPMRSPKDTMSRRIIVLAAFAIAAALGLPLATAMAETVEVAPGAMVTKKIFGGPDSEAPFFGFADKSSILRQADDISVSIAVQLYGSRAKAFEALARRGWEALEADDFKQSTARFNQASLFAPAQSQIFHGFAIIAYTHHNDPQFADELFRVARKQPGALAGLNADYGHMLLAA